MRADQGNCIDVDSQGKYCVCSSLGNLGDLWEYLEVPSVDSVFMSIVEYIFYECAHSAHGKEALLRYGKDVGCE